MTSKRFGTSFFLGSLSKRMMMSAQHDAQDFAIGGDVDFAAFSQAMTQFRFDPLDTHRDRVLSPKEIKASR